jgi:DNA recombination protein RmuC
MQIALLVILLVVLSGIVWLSLQLNRGAPRREELSRLSVLNEQKDKQISDLQAKAKVADELVAQNARLASDLENERKVAQEKLRLLADAQAQMKLEFENLANKIFEEKGKTFTAQNKEKLDGLLLPLREQLESFRKRVDDVHKDDTAGMAKLLEQVRQLQELNSRVSEEANNLASAIKGDSKTQGNWGELIIERIFEASGLARGREYDAQVGLRAEDGRLQKPDFVVYLPGDKAVIVDSKVSLTAFERFCSAQDDTEKKIALTEHLLSIRKHIDELKEKQYHHLLGNRTLDFVIMCVPVESAYQLSIQEDGDLIYDLARGPVIMTGPATLMLVLKLIAQIWRRENENRNVVQIADRAGRLYDQVALIIDAMLDSQGKLEGVRKSFELVMSRLQGGKGNLVGRVEELKKLGAKTNKLMPPEVLEKAIGQGEEENLDS